MPLLDLPTGHLEYLRVGSGSPVTLFVHGLGGSIPETRPFGSGVHGSRVFLHLRGHGASSAPDDAWTYAAVADEVAALADHVDATRALGVSLGAGALLRLAVASPTRFERLVMVLPAAIDRVRADPAVRRLHALADLLDARDVDGAAALLLEEQPESARSREDVAVWCARQARRLAGTAVTRALRELAGQHPIDDRAQLAGVTAPVLVVGQRGDSAHPATVAEELAGLLPAASLRVFDSGGVLWSHRAELRRLVSGFLNA